MAYSGPPEISGGLFRVASTRFLPGTRAGFRALVRCTRGGPLWLNARGPWTDTRKPKTYWAKRAASLMAGAPAGGRAP
ncbi:hypothetical protein RA21_18755, partial [Leisingera sp. ANG-DT]